MPKNTLQDIVPPEKKSIRNIPIPTRNTRSSKPPTSQVGMKAEGVSSVSQNSNPKETPASSPARPSSFDTYQPPTRNGRHSKKAVWVGIVGAVVVIFVFIASLFSSATVSITPKQVSASPGERQFSATKTPSGNQGISFDVIRISKEGGTQVMATGEEEVERKASGMITIFNDFDENNQRLIRNTRFETPEGLIYRIDESVVVPGKSGNTPGSIEVMVYADEPGANYNIGLSDFTIPGFEGDPRFESMYARSNTPMTGGMVGVVKTVSEADKAQAQQTIRARLMQELREEIKNQVPESFLVVEDSFSYEWKELPQTNIEESRVTINEEGTIFAIILNKEILAQYFARELAPDLPQGNVRLLDTSNVSIEIQDVEEFNPEESQEFTFTVGGSVALISSINEENIRNDLVGKSRKDMNSILANYTAVQEARASIKPFWKQSFPEDADKIRIQEVITVQ